MKILGFTSCMFGDSSLRWVGILGWLELHRADDALAFFYHDHLVRLDVLQGFHQAAGPAYLQQFHLFRFANAEMDAQIILRKISAAAAHFVDLRVNVFFARSEEHTSELQSRLHLVCRLLLEKKKKNKYIIYCLAQSVSIFCHQSSL